jgi:SAM-dependent methyltransferase
MEHVQPGTDITGDEWRLIAVLERLDKTGRLPTAEDIELMVTRKVPSITQDWRQIATVLEARGIVNVGAAVMFTERGLAYRDAARRQGMLVRFFYDEFYEAAENSAAHSEFCRQVYGLDLCQHGTMDMAQLRLMADMLKDQGARRIIDLGCGNGMISEHIGDMLGAFVLGVDFSDPTIARANERVRDKSERMIFVAGDIGGMDPGKAGAFDAALAVDSLYFVADLHKAVGSIRNILRPSGRLYAFWHFAPLPDGARDAPENTRLAKALEANGFAYTTLDLTAENRGHWLLKKQVLLQLKDRFEREGNMFLYNNRMDECEGTLHEWSRFLYSAQA